MKHQSTHARTSFSAHDPSPDSTARTYDGSIHRPFIAFTSAAAGKPFITCTPPVLPPSVRVFLSIFPLSLLSLLSLLSSLLLLLFFLWLLGWVSSNCFLPFELFEPFISALSVLSDCVCRVDRWMGR